MGSLFNKTFKITFLFIFLLELFSLFGYLLPTFEKIAFFIIALTALAITLSRLEYGVWLVLIELFIGSKGYLFYFEYGDTVISIRLALWLIVMSVWLGKVVVELFDSKDKLSDSPDQLKSLSFLRSSYLKYFLALFLFISWGIINGFLNNNEFNNIFFDFNGWLYFVLVFPVFSVIRSRLDLKTIWNIFSAAIIWLVVKTFFLLFAFSHNITGLVYELYRWVRTTGVGEITQIQGGFYRIFFQSHIFVLIGFFIFALLISQILISNKQKKFSALLPCRQTGYFLLSTFCFSVILISFSRSFWIGLIFGLVILISIIVWLADWKKAITTLATILVVSILSIGVVAIIVKFPYPKPLGGFSTTSLISERAQKITGEAAVSSRWALLPALWQEIKKAPILGQGFGATVTYKSDDPRVLESAVGGQYTTYAFEWGWLDIWLKLGLVGMLAYLLLIGKILWDGFMSLHKQAPGEQSKKQVSSLNIYFLLGSLVGLLVISIVSIFSPYMNHPLGIGYLILVSAIIRKGADYSTPV